MVDGPRIQRGTLPIKVSRDVVSHLSLGLYRNFARAVKELVSNAYDAMATEVKIKLDLDENRIVVRDNGRGMDLDEIRKNFLTIGYRTSISEAPNEFGRMRIGTFGIGCLSVFPYCDAIQLVTKKRNDDKIVELRIDTKSFFTEEQAFRFIEQATVPYEVYPSDLPQETGETITVLEGIKPQIARELHQEEFRGKSSIDKYSGFEKFKWTLSQYAPIQFPPNREDLRSLFEQSDIVPMRLWLDGEELFRNVPTEAVILEKGQEQFGQVSFKYTIMTTMKPIEPEEARGLQIRIRNVAIGLPRDFDVTKLTGKVLGKLNYLCGEVHILKGLDSSLMIDRDSLSYTEDVASLYEFFRKSLIKWNDTLEKWAVEDKEIYESLMNVGEGDKIVEELRKADIVRFSRERLRLPKAPSIQRKIREIVPRSERIFRALSRVPGYDLAHSNERVSANELPIKVNREDKTICVFDKHPDLIETIEVGGKQFEVKYDQWDVHGAPYSICKLSDHQKAVIFNRSHKLFKSKINDEVIKKISLGIVLILKDTADSEALIAQLNELLEQALLG